VAEGPAFGISELVTLVTGFGGVVLGGLVTYLTETHFRAKEREEETKRNFRLVMADLGRVIDELFSIYLSLAQELPKKKPELIFSETRIIASSSVEPIAVSTEKLFSVSDSKEALFSELTLCFRRFNSTVLTLQRLNEQRAEFQQYNQKNVVELPSEDIASFEIDASDMESCMALVRIENFYRDFFRYIIRDVEDALELAKKANAVSERKFHRSSELPPKIEISKEFSPLPYLKKIGRFELSDLKAS